MILPTVPGLNKTYQSIALYFGVFAIAYAGFLYQLYAASQESVDSRSLLEKVLPTAVNNSSQNAHKSDRQTAAVNDFAADAKSNKPDNESTINESASSKNAETNNPAESAKKLESTYRQHDSNKQAFATLSTQPDRRVPLNGLSVSGASAPTGSNTAAVSSRTSSTSPDTGFTNENTSSNNTENDSVGAAADSQNTSSEAANDNASTATENDNTSPPEQAEEQRMATPNCPYRLPDGSTKEDATGMQAAYGCRYRNSCINLNDGSGTYACHWEYIR